MRAVRDDAIQEERRVEALAEWAAVVVGERDGDGVDGARRDCRSQLVSEGIAVVNPVRSYWWLLLWPGAFLGLTLLVACTLVVGRCR